MIQMKRLRTAAAVVIILAIFGILGRALWKNWQQIPFGQLHFNYSMVITSYVCMFAFFLVAVSAWRKMLFVYGARLSFSNAFGVLGISQLGKYIPGKVWFAVGRMYLASRFGVAERISIVTVLLETSLLAISAGMIAVSTVVAPWVENFSVGVSVLVAAIVACGLIVVHPKIFGRLVDFAALRLKRQRMEMNLTYGGIINLLVLYCITWIFQGIAFFLMIKSFYDIEIVMWPTLWGVYALAWILGFLNLLTPAGLGVREGIMTFLLSFYVPLSVAVIIALVARVWTAVADLLFFLVALPGFRRWRKLELGGQR